MDLNLSCNTIGPVRLWLNSFPIYSWLCKHSGLGCMLLSRQCYKQNFFANIIIIVVCCFCKVFSSVVICFGFLSKFVIRSQQGCQHELKIRIKTGLMYK